jgi:hypothetical protein
MLARSSIGVSESAQQEFSPTFSHDSALFERFPEICLKTVVETFVDLIVQFEQL